jgi:hypothetical protein
MATSREIAERFIAWNALGKGKPECKLKNTTVWYKGNKFYSYSTCVAMYHEEMSQLLITSTWYSNTTSQHLGCVSRSARSHDVARLWAADIYWPQAPVNYKRFVDAASKEIKRAMRARTNTGLGMFNAHMTQAKEHCAITGMVFNPDDFNPRALLDDKLFTKYVAERLIGETSSAYA